ncbi:phosphopantetheine-binding protein, partial [Flavitalea sp. BT771]|uniref:phosphopantetheine-binding protein n=1 Tax=Flavitalea sp. BT771 TaxID=3063329 RepID=UPI0026E3325A
EGVKEAVVVDREDEQGNKYLQGYVVMEERNGDGRRDWRELLSGRLPAQMIPRDVMEIGRIPLTENGKIDRWQLPEIKKGAGLPGGGEHREASNEVEEALVEIWREVLGVDVFGVRDNFFELGGHSLKATQVASRIRRRLGVTLEIQSIFEYPTIETLGSLIEDALMVIKYSNEKTSAGELKEIRI